MTKVYIATPAYDGRVHVPYAIALAETACTLNANNIAVELAINYGGSLLICERNKLIMSFLRSDCTHMLCVDSDLGWPGVAVMKLLEHDRDIAVGLYPSRLEKLFVFRPVLNEDKSFVKDDRHLFKMEYVPAGFMLIKRKVIEELVKKFPELYFKPKDEAKANEDGYAFFDTQLYEGEFWGEDYIFSRRVRESGFDIWVDPFIEFDHAGVKGAFVHIFQRAEEDEKKKSSEKLTLE